MFHFFGLFNERVSFSDLRCHSTLNEPAESTSYHSESIVSYPTPSDIYRMTTVGTGQPLPYHTLPLVQCPVQGISQTETGHKGESISSKFEGRTKF